MDLVHPSLFPLVYGRTKIIPRGRVGLTDCMDYVGKGEVLKIPDESEIEVQWYGQSSNLKYKTCSANFQWLPCQLKFTGSEAVSITSYINNLHPVKFSSLYDVIGACIARAIPLWNRTLSSVKVPGKHRIDLGRTDYDYFQGRKMPVDYKADESSDEDVDKEDEWLKSTRVLVQPEPQEYERRAKPASVDLRKQFQESGLQIIVKLANIGKCNSVPFILRTHNTVIRIIQEYLITQNIFKYLMITSDGR